jgi:CotH kinase protein/Chitobiase/beta-hexosaminidase C-terminal domain
VANLNVMMPRAACPFRCRLVVLLAFLPALAPPDPSVGQSPHIPTRVRDLKFAAGRGVYDGPLTETITSATRGATIVYTTDGTEPTQTNGTTVPGLAGAPVTASVAIRRTTVLRVAAFRAGHTPTRVHTHTYVIVPDVLAQDGTGVPPHAPWGHKGPDWAMDPRIVSSPRHAQRLTGDLRSVPSVALTMDWADLFGGAGRGIYIQGEDVEKPAIAELLVPAGQPGQSFDAGATVQIVGGSSTLRWRSDKLSLRLEFPGDLRADVFDEPGAATRFDTLVLDAGFNNHWHYGGHIAPETQRIRAQFVYDQYVSDLQRAAGGYAPRGRPVFLYLNGVFWGLHMLHERPDADFAASYLGGSRDEYDVLKHAGSIAVSGGRGSYRELVAAVQKDLTIPQHYQAVASLLDIDDFIRYLAVNCYVGNYDWSTQNWYATFNSKSGAGSWRFHNWDAELIMDHVERDVTEMAPADKSGPKYLHSRLRANADYRTRFGDIVHALAVTPGAPLTPERAAALYRLRLAQIDRAVVPESARWGDNRRATPFTREDWLARRDVLLKTYFPGRTDVVLAQLRADGLYPAAAPVTFSLNGTPTAGGVASHGDTLTMGAGSSGTIYYTLDRTDPRAPGGTIRGRAYTEGIRVTAPLTLIARSHDGLEWSPVAAATFSVAPSLPLTGGPRN